MSRLTLPNGDWADFDTRLNYAQARRIREASGTLDQEATFVCALVRAWAIRGTNDEPINFPERDTAGIPLGALDAVPFDTFQAMVVHAANEIEGVPDPKDTSGTSTGSKQEASPSASRRTSPRPTSSSTIQDGATPTFKPPLPM
jgi:hypothetical protein